MWGFTETRINGDRDQQKQGSIETGINGKGDQQRQGSMKTGINGDGISGDVNQQRRVGPLCICLLYTSDAADE